MRRVLLLFVIAALALAGCAPQATPAQTDEPAAVSPEAVEPTDEVVEATEPAAEVEEPAAEPVEIEFWHSLTGDFGNVLNALVVEYNEVQDNVTVVPVYKGNYQDTQKALLAALAAKNGPDVAQLEVSFAATLASKGVLAPVGDFATDPEKGLPAEELDAIFPGFMEAVSFNGVMYTMPFNMSVPVLYYNADMLEAAGVAVPQTWEDFAEACKAVTAGEQFGFTINAGNVWIWEAMVMQNGGEMFSADYSEVKFNEPAAVEALDYLVDLVEAGCAKGQSWEEGRTEFFNGKVAFLEDSSGSLSGVVANSPFKVGVVHIPWGSEQVATIGGATLGIFDTGDAAKQAAAWEFVKYMTSPEAISRLSADTGYMPTSDLAMELDPLKSLMAEDPAFAAMLESLPYTRPRPMVEGYAEISNLIKDAIEKAVLQQQTAQEALDAAAAGALEVLGR